VLILYPDAFLKVCIRSNSLLVESLGSFMYSIIVSNRDSLTFPFPIYIPFILFSCLITLAKNSSTTSNKSADNGYLCLAPDSEGNAFGFFPTRYNVGHRTVIYSL
jgi:hypothetical protein